MAVPPELIEQVQAIVDKGVSEDRRVWAWDAIRAILLHWKLAWFSQEHCDRVAVHTCNRSTFGVDGHDGAMPRVVTITMPGYKDVDTDEEVPPLAAKVKSSIDFRSKIAVQAEARVWLHIIGANKAHEADAAVAHEASAAIGYVTWRADKQCFLAREKGKQGKSKHFKVSPGATEEEKQAILAKAKEWAKDADECNDEENIDEQDIVQDA